MKKFYILTLLFFGCLFLANAQDVIIMTDGNVTEAVVIERTETEVRYRRYDNLTGPIHVLPLSFVLTIRYENGSVWLANAPASGQPVTQPTGEAAQVTTISQALILILNRMPPIRVAGNNLQFEFTVDSWVAKVNGQPLFQGTIEYDGTDEGGMLTLKQTHMYPGAAAATAGRLARNIPGAGAIAGHVESAGQLAGGLVGAVEATGPEIVLEYRAGPPPSLSLLAYRGGERDASQQQREPRQPYEGEKDTAWADKWFYLGGTIGGGVYSRDNDSDYFGGRRYSSSTVPVYSFGLTAELALLQYLQLEADFMFATDGKNNYTMTLPILARVGGKIPSNYLERGGGEYTLDLGYTFGAGPTVGVTLGFLTQYAGIMYARGQWYFPSYGDGAFLFLVGYKVGLGGEKARMARE